MSQIGINPPIGGSSLLGGNTLIDSNVANLTPALYAGAIGAGLNPAQSNQVNQIAGTVALNKQLLSMDKNSAQTKWRTLDPSVQEQVKALYGTTSYMPTQPQNFVMRALKDVGNTVLGPFKTAFKVAGNYGQLINTPYLAIREITQGANPFDWNVWRKAYDGTMIYDQGSLEQLHKQYGDTDTFVAMKTLQGLKPGQIIDAYGKVNSDIINSIAKMVNEPDKFVPMLNQFKGAQVSVGRDIARVMFNAQPTDNKLFSSSKWNKVSGLLDAITQVVIDPLTWVTGGTAGIAEHGTLFGSERAGSLAASITGQRAEYLAGMLARDPSAANVEKVFANPAIQRTWNDVAGPIIERYTNAIKDKDYNGAAIARRDLGQKVPALNNDGMLALLSRNEVFDAKSAQKLFSYSEPLTQLLAGNVDGTTFFRNGVPIAKRTSLISSGLNRVIGDFFNGSLEKSALDKIGPDFVKDLEKVGLENSPIYGAQADSLKAATDELSGVRRRLGRFAARHPGSTGIDITDRGVDRTLPTVRDLARTIYPKSHAEYFAQAFKDSTEPDRVILLRGLYVQIMHNMGLHGTADGKNLMEEILKEKFGNGVNFSATKTLDVAPQHANAKRARGLLEEQPEQKVGGLLSTSLEGPIHPYQATPLIGNLPWHGQAGQASLADYAFNFNKNKQLRDVVSAMGGVTRKNFTRHMVDSWSSATLFPRLGIRSAIDEGFFYLMGQPGRDLWRYAQGRKIAKGIAAFTGSEELIPPIKKMILNKLGKNPLKAIPEKTVYTKDGEIIHQGRAVKVNDINGEELWRLAKREDIANEAMKVINNTIPEYLHDYIYQAMVHHPDVAKSIANSIIGKSGLDESLGNNIASQIISSSHLSQMYKESGLAKVGKYAEFNTEEMAKANEALPAMMHYDNWFMRFTKNMADFSGGPGRTAGNYFYDPATVFMLNRGLKTEEDFTRAADTLLSRVGIDPKTMTVENQEVLDNYLRFSQHSIKEKINGYTPVESAVKRIEVALHDMYNQFHGGAASYNDRLYNYITELAHTIQDEEKLGSNKAMREALNSVDYKKFAELTKGFNPQGMINADVGFAKEATNEGAMQAMDRWNSIQHQSMEWMDAQNNHLFRQPALWLTYAKYRERYASLEKKFVEEQVKLGTPRVLAEQLGEKRFTEIAMSHASNNVLTYVDNPRVRSNLAWTLRTTGRFYRATEDFYRRLFRLKDITPQIIYRMRLANIGFQSNGFIHPDQNGNPYLVIPGDNIMFHALNFGVGVVTGKTDVIKQPMYNDFAINIAMGNPSFQQDAGQPSLSGPFIAVPVMGLKYALGWFGGGWGKQQASNIDKLILGPVNQNLTPMKAIVPSLLQRIWGMIPKGEWDQQTTSAAMQAVAYNMAHGNIVSPAEVARWPKDQYNSKVADSLDSVKWTVHNILFLRGFLGMLSPVSPSLLEDKGVPNYIKNSGINGLRPEFADILQAVMRNAQGNIQDPYEAALMAFTGKYPGKSVYTVARTGAQQIMVQKSQQTQQWMQSYADKIAKYGDASLIFAPNVGQYDSNVYTWMEGMGLIKQKPLKDYFRDVATAQDKQTWFDLGNLETQALRNPSLDAEQRQSYMNQITAAKDSLKAKNPYLEAALNQTGYGIGKQEDMLVSLQGILADPNFPMTSGVRAKMGTATAIVQHALDAISYIGVDQDAIDGGLQKQTLKNNAIQAIRELGGAQGQGAPEDTQIQEALRAIFIPLLDNKARTTLKAVGR